MPNIYIEFDDEVIIGPGPASQIIQKDNWLTYTGPTGKKVHVNLNKVRFYRIEES